MNAQRNLLLTGILLTMLTGCQGGMPPRRSMAANEPILDVPGDSSGTLASAAPSSSGGTSVVDRHPLLSRPRDYYESSGENKIVKTASATFIGIPAGVVGELKQIVTGQPAAPR